MNLIANWNISLNCDCPECEKYVDLLECPDFWDGRTFQAGENSTPKTRNVDVICPSCGYEFIVDLEY